MNFFKKNEEKKDEKKEGGFKDKKKDDKPKDKGPYYRKLIREHNIQLMPTMSKHEDTVLNINMERFSLDAASEHSTPSSYEKTKKTMLGRLKKRIADKYHKYIPHKERKDLILDQHLVKQEENKPEFAVLFVLVFVTFWCGFICQTIALMLCVLGHTAVEEGDYYRARIHQKCAIFFIILGLVLFTLLLLPLNQPYEPPFKQGIETNKTWYCDPGCFYQVNRDRCYC